MVVRNDWKLLRWTSAFPPVSGLPQKSSTTVGPVRRRVFIDRLFVRRLSAKPRPKVSQRRADGGTPCDVSRILAWKPLPRGATLSTPRVLFLSPHEDHVNTFTPCCVTPESALPSSLSRPGRPFTSRRFESRLWSRPNRVGLKDWFPPPPPSWTPARTTLSVDVFPFVRFHWILVQSSRCRNSTRVSRDSIVNIETDARL